MVVIRGESCWLPHSPAAGWASILPSLGEGSRLRSRTLRLWEAPQAWLALKGKMWVQWGAQIQWEPPLSCLQISGVILSLQFGEGQEQVHACLVS